MNQQIRNYGLVIKWLLLHLSFPTPEFPRMSFVTHPNQKHTRKGVMGNVVQPTRLTQYKGVIRMFQLPKHHCITEFFPRNNFSSASYLCPNLCLSPNSTSTVTSPNIWGIWYFHFSTSHNTWLLFTCLFPLLDSKLLKVICHIFPFILEPYCLAHCRCFVTLSEQKKLQCLWYLVALDKIVFQLMKPLWRWNVLICGSTRILCLVRSSPVVWQTVHDGPSTFNTVSCQSCHQKPPMSRRWQILKECYVFASSGRKEMHW